MNWNNTKVFVTGGASFIGTNLIKKLLTLGAQITVLDNLSTGKLENIESYLQEKLIQFHERDILKTDNLAYLIKGHDIIFHLAAKHGGRGYIERNESDCCDNFAIDNCTINAAYRAGVKKFVFASSGCVYPVSIQKDPSKKVVLKEDIVSPPYDADNLYGWGKLMAELTLKAFHKEKNFKSVACRFFTAYGPYATESHAIMSLIAKAYVRQNPFEIWGDGSQIRNWTYIDDIVDGFILAAEHIEDGSAINIGNNIGITVNQAARMITQFMGYSPKFLYLNSMPVGPLNRVADVSLSKKLLGWEPKTSFEEGILKTIEWYKLNKSENYARNYLLNNNQ